MAKRRPAKKRQRTGSVRFMTVANIMRLPPPPPETEAQRLERFSRFVGPHDPGNILHSLACGQCHREAMQAIEDADLREEVRLISSRRISRRRSGTLSAEALAAHLARHPIGKRKPDGALFSGNERVAALKREQNIVIHRTTLGRRLATFRPAEPIS